MKINQIIAIEKTTKNRVQDAFTGIYQKAGQADLFDGLSRQYEAIDEAGEKLPAESKKVQAVATESLREALRVLTELYDITATKDFSNQVAKADVIVDGKTIAFQAPVSFLLFLEKQLVDLRTFVLALPTLDPAEDWKFDANTNIYRTEPKSTHRSKKVQKAIVLYDATDKHPAQTQLITEDVLAGFWKLTKLSGAMPVPTKKSIVSRIEKLQVAIKIAREEANATQAIEQSVGNAIAAFVLEGI